MGGGTLNSSFGLVAAIGGGTQNQAGDFASVGGGGFNDASGAYSVVSGGELNQASGDHGFSAGCQARALHDHTFVWSGTTSPFASTAPQQFLIEAPGGVGIGTNAPTAALSVVGPIDSTGEVSVINPDNPSARAHLSWLDDVARIRVGGSGAGAQSGLDIQTTGNVSLMRITGSGNVGSGVTSPGVRLDVAGSVRSTGFINTSDVRLKTNVDELDGALDKVLELRGVSFDWDREQLPEAEDCRQLGFIAQELREVLPEVVREDADGTLAVAYTQLIPVLVEALKEQSLEIAELRAAVEELRGE